MPVDTRADTGLLIRLGRPGLAVAASAVMVAIVGLEDTRLAIGFLVPLLVAALTDGVVGARVLTTRAPIVEPVRTIAAAPHAPAVAVRAPAGRIPVVFRLDPLSPRDPEPAAFELPLDGAGVQQEFAAGLPHAVFHLRYRTSATLFGFVRIDRWTVQRVPGGLYRGPRLDTRAAERPRAHEDLLRLREYVPGDRMARVSWPTTARTGELHVRVEDAADDEVIVRVDLGTNPDDAVLVETLERAAAVCRGYLDAGVPLRVHTRTFRPSYYAGLTAAAIESPGRRATPGPVGIDADGWVHLPDGVGNDHIENDAVTADDELTMRLALADVGPPPPPPAGPYVQVDGYGVRVRR